MSSFPDLVAVEFHDPESVIFFARFVKKHESRGRHWACCWLLTRSELRELLWETRSKLVERKEIIYGNCGGDDDAGEGGDVIDPVCESQRISNSSSSRDLQQWIWFGAEEEPQQLAQSSVRHNNNRSCSHGGQHGGHVLPIFPHSNRGRRRRRRRRRRLILLLAGDCVEMRVLWAGGRMHSSVHGEDQGAFLWSFCVWLVFGSCEGREKTPRRRRRRRRLRRRSRSSRHGRSSFQSHESLHQVQHLHSSRPCCASSNSHATDSQAQCGAAWSHSQQTHERPSLAAIRSL